MRTAFRKLRNNLLNARAVKVLGVAQYLRWLALFLRHLPRVLREGNIYFLDPVVGRRLRRFNYRGRVVLYDCARADEAFASGKVQGGAWAFGYLREIYIRDCYFKYLPPRVFEEARVVLDLGVNCGIFSSLMAPGADFIVGVDVNPGFLPLVEHNLRGNGLRRFALEHGFMGRGGMFAPDGAEYLTIDDLLTRHGLDHVDLVKMDIEGSEFALFEDDAWLAKVGALTMEVHPGYPGLDRMMDALDTHGFQVVMANQDLARVEDPQQAEFLYAWKN